MQLRVLPPTSNLCWNKSGCWQVWTWVVKRQHRYSTCSAAMLQHKLHVFCCPFFGTFNRGLTMVSCETTAEEVSFAWSRKWDAIIVDSVSVVLVFSLSRLYCYRCISFSGSSSRDQMDGRPQGSVQRCCQGGFFCSQSSTKNIFQSLDPCIRLQNFSSQRTLFATGWIFFFGFY